MAADVTVRPGVADNVDGVAMRPCRGKHLVQGVDRLRFKLGERPSQIGERVGCNDTCASAVRHNGNAASRDASDASENFGCIEHLVQIDNAQDSRAAQRGGIDVIGARKRPRVRKLQPSPLRGGGRPLSRSRASRASTASPRT